MTATTAPGGGQGPTGTRFGVPAVLSALLHASLVVAVLIAGRQSSRPMPPIYRVELVAAPKGPSAIGAVARGGGGAFASGTAGVSSTTICCRLWVMTACRMRYLPNEVPKAECQVPSAE